MSRASASSPRGASTRPPSRSSARSGCGRSRWSPTTSRSPTAASVDTSPPSRPSSDTSAPDPRRPPSASPPSAKSSPGCAQLVRVTVRVTPEAVTTVDGRLLRAIPGRAITLDPTPVFAWTAPDHRPERRELPGVAGSSVSLDVTLRPTRGRLTVEPTPATAAVSVDGRPLGAGRHELALPPGEHWVEVRAAGFVPARRAVRVGATGVVRLSLSLEREPTPAWVLPTVIGASVAGLGTVVAVLVAVLRPTIPGPARLLGQRRGCERAPPRAHWCRCCAPCWAPRGVRSPRHAGGRGARHRHGPGHRAAPRARPAAPRRDYDVALQPQLRDRPAGHAHAGHRRRHGGGAAPGRGGHRRGRP
ncbi:MAG: PEGA domain-containing protein [Deltaproteobacteria bacterium]|nr:PEGA domain-containing protein [Deltaproteobacteria bacterium]